MFAYGRDLFLYSLGNLLVNFSQTILITRVAGLDTAAVWAVCTRAFALLTQALHRLFDYSCAGLAEMIVRQELERLRQRLQAAAYALDRDTKALDEAGIGGGRLEMFNLSSAVQPDKETPCEPSSDSSSPSACSSSPRSSGF